MSQVMAFYRTCPYCSANLDPGEHCDCQDRKRREQEHIIEMLAREADGQMVLKEAVRYGAYTGV